MLGFHAQVSGLIKLSCVYNLNRMLNMLIHNVRVDQIFLLFEYFFKKIFLIEFF
jgi:hypothetical protein